MSFVPVIDLSSDDVVRQINDACEQVGFLTVVGHGVDAGIIDNVWTSAREFFDLPLEARMGVAMPFAGYPYGYSPFAGETLAESLGNGGPPDQKSSFGIGPVRAATHPFNDPDEASAWSPNLWPSVLPDMKPAWDAYYLSMADLSARILRLMGAALGLPSDYFESLIDRHTSAMRAIDYPGRPESSNDHLLGAGAHTDYGTWTVAERGSPSTPCRDLLS
jgi:isopenicillin N synthase-like dioxygenase